ncbi:ATP-dependent helicase [Propionibacterium freudenreichii]|uniref:UvrD-helicase domain-containing protein n=1 Tax=Propionibacterium freudenreichii TaxID=1744 RepID=UPI0021A7BA2A|nr:ATP-dependent helicase [Propionibacterium freudenreichii]MCT2977628.1 ATP-dependent helicase [Propionibacterium freudenreichii]MCT2985398.1 ATP-dependent helicase [Propionibacterium freudenreichii]
MLTPTPKQLAIRDAKDLDLLVVAPAGCGKTEALALRVQGLLQRCAVAAPQKILVTSFSNRARDNIKERLRSYLPPLVMRDRVSVVNFHGLAARLIRAHANVIGMSPDWVLPESDWVGDQLRKRDTSWSDRGPIQEALRVTKQEPYDDDAVEAELRRIGNATALEIEELRKAEMRLTYDDLPRLAELIVANEAVADLYVSHFGAVVVDEFQDLTPQQLRIVNRIGYKRTTYGGDLAQGIYGFAGAQPTQIDRAIREECSRVIEFSDSHRSSPAVLGMVNSLIPLTSGQVLTSADPASWPSGGLAGSIAHQTADDEATWIVAMAKAILSHVPNQRMGVVARTGPRRRFIDAAFAESDVPHFRWDDGVLDTDTAKLVRAVLARFDSLSYNKAADKVAFLRNAAGFETITDVDVRKSTIDALGWVQDLLAEGIQAQDIRTRIKIGDSSTLITSPGVHLLSGHVGKGQQFDWVFVVGVEEDFIPFSMATTPDEVTEEARVLSVMISRARHGVILSRAASVPTNGGYPRSRSASRFLRTIATAAPLDAAGIIAWFEVADWNAIAKR